MERMEKQLTAVEWLIKELYFYPIDDIVIDKFNQAKEMEKEQRKNDFREGWHGNKHKDWNCEFYLQKYLNETFKSE